MLAMGTSNAIENVLHAGFLCSNKLFPEGGSAYNRGL